MKTRQRIISTLVLWVALFGAGLIARALNPSLPPGGNFDLSHWYIQLPTSGGVLTGTAGSVDSASTDQLVGGFTNAYFYTGPDGAMTFWVPDNGATTSGSTHPRSELREQILPGSTSSNWTVYGTHIMTATCVVSNVPSDTGKVCIGQMHEPNTKPDGSASVGNEHMIMFDFNNKKIYVNVSPDGDEKSTFSTTFISGSANVKLGVPIHYTMAIVDGLLQIVINNVTNAWDLFSGTNYSGLTFQNWDAASGNTLYFKAGAYNQTTNACGCSTDGARVAFYALTIYHAANITNQPASQSVPAGNNATFTVAASSNGPLGYQWWFNETNLLTGATNAAFTLTNISATNAGDYTVVVSDQTSSFQSVTSAVATLVVTGPQSNFTFSIPGTNLWLCPTGVTSIRVECWGGGGAGGSAIRTPNSGTVQYGGGGAGGAYARMNSYSVIPGNTYYVAVGAGGVAATGTLVNDTTVSGGDSWFNATDTEPAGAGSCVAKGGEGGECAVGNTSTTAYGTGGAGTTNGCLGDVFFAGGSGGTLSGSTGFGGSGGGSGGTAGDGNSGGTSGGAALAVVGGGPGGAPNATSGSSGPGQAPSSGPGGGGGGARASSQQTGGSGGAGQVTLTYMNSPAVTPVVIGWNMATDGSTFSVSGTGGANQTYVLMATPSLAAPAVWTPVVTNTAGSDGIFSFSDMQAGNFTQRFYQVASP